MFLSQAQACAETGSPLTAGILRLLADAMQPGTPVADKVLNWQGDLSRSGDALALRLAAGLHALVLSGTDPALTALYREPTAGDAEATALLLATLKTHEAHLLHWLQSPPQTNEVRRSIPLIALAHWLTAGFNLLIHLSELGASAGLNLMFDHYGLTLATRFGPTDVVLDLHTNWTGPLPPAASPVILDRAGVDLNPLDPVKDRLRLLSYIWPDQPDRLARTATALDLAAHLRPEIA